MKKIVISSVAMFAMVAGFSVANAAVSASEIYTPASGLLTVGSGMGAKMAQMPNVMAAQKALLACTGSVDTDGKLSDGKFGVKTADLFRNFQISKGIKVDGIIGAQTAGELAKCSGNTTTGGSTGSLSGGAGDLDITGSVSSSSVEDEVKEGEEDVIIFGVKTEADGSDIAITSVKVNFANTGTSGTENFEKYVDEVSVWLGDKKVGSADADDFSKESGSPDEFSKTISLSGAVVKEDDEEKLYVAVSAVSTIDTEDLDAEWDIALETVRFNDSTGAILSADVDDYDSFSDNAFFSFIDSSDEDDIEVKSSSDNPDDATIKVEDDKESDEELALAFRLDVDEDSSDVFVTEMTLEVRLQDSSAATAEDVIDSVMVKVGNEEFEADFDDETSPDSDFVATYIVEIDNEDLTIGSGDIEDVEVYVVFAEQDEEANYNNGTIATVSLVAMDAETEDDEIDSISGMPKVGADLTLDTISAEISGMKWSVNSVGTIIDFIFTVEADDEDFEVLLAEIEDSTDGTATISSGTLSRTSGDADSISGGFEVLAGDKATFRVRYNVSGDNGDDAEVIITSVAGQQVADDMERSPTAVLNVNN